MFQWVKSELLFRVRTARSFTRGRILCLAGALCLQLSQFATSSACWAVPVLLSACLDHDPKGKARQASPAVFSTLWLSDRLGFVCPTIGMLGIAEISICRGKTRLTRRLCSAPTSLYLQSALIPVHTYDWVVPITLWNFPVGTLSGRAPGGCMLLDEFQWPRVSEMGWMMAEPVLPLLCHYSAALLCEGRLEKPLQVM